MKTEFYVVENCPGCKRPNFFKESNVHKGDRGQCWGCHDTWRLSFGATGRSPYCASWTWVGLRDTSNNEDNMSRKTVTGNEVDPNIITSQEVIKRDEIDNPVKSRYDHDLERAKELVRGLYLTTYMQHHTPNLQWVRELLEIAERSQIFINSFGTLGGDKVP